MKTTIFLGPTMTVDEARNILPNATYLPPAAQGDLLTAVNQGGAEIIGLIDGTFHQTLSVWHSEICFLLSKGITIFGASSMGALRAAETERYGMVGVGTIFKWYRDGSITRDDEVALVHGTEEFAFKPMSLSLVNIRASLANAVSRGLLTESEADLVINCAGSLYYPERQVLTIVSECRVLGLTDTTLETVRQALTTDYVDLKKADAYDLLKQIQMVIDGRVPRPSKVEFDFSRSSVFEALYNLDQKMRVDDVSISLQSIREYGSLHQPDFEIVHRAALDRAIVCYLGAMIGLHVTPDEMKRARQDFFKVHDLDSPELLQKWLGENAMSEDDLNEYLTNEVICERLRRWIVTIHGMDRGCRVVLNEARMRRAFPQWAKSTAEMHATINTYRHEAEYQDLLKADPRELAARHHANTGVHINGDVRVWASDAGFGDVRDLQAALIESAIYYDVRYRIEQQLNILQNSQNPFEYIINNSQDTDD